MLNLDMVATAVAVVAVFVLFGATSLLLTRSWLQRRFGRISRHILFAGLLVEFFALVIDLLAFGANEHYIEVKELVGQEASVMATFYRGAQNFPDEERCALQSLVNDYVNHTINVVWPAQVKGEIVQSGGRLDAIQKALMAYEPNGAAEASSQFVMFNQFGNYNNLRRERQTQVDIGVQPLLYAALFVAGLMLIASTCLQAIGRTGTHFALTVALSFFVGLFLFLTVALDYPLRGTNPISAAAWKAVAANALHDPVDGRLPGCARTVTEYVTAAGVDPLGSSR